MEAKHLKLDYEKAVITKKQLLSSELGLLNIIKKIREYRLARMNEFIIKNKLKTELKLLETKLNLILSSLPKTNSKKIQKTQKSKDEPALKKDSKKGNIEKQLEEIKEKLRRLK